MHVFTRAWWEAAGSRAANTAIAAFLPLATLLVAGEVTPLYVLSLVGLAAVASLLTSMAGLPELTDRTVPLWRAVLVRSVKTLGQVGIPALGSVTLLELVDWRAFAVSVGGAVLVTFLRTLRDYLPESAPAIEVEVAADSSRAVHVHVSADTSQLGEAIERVCRDLESHD